MVTFKKQIIFIVLVLLSSAGVMTQESSSSQEQDYTGVLFNVLPTLEQTVQLSLIKRIVLGNEDISEIRQEYLPNYIKGINDVAYLIRCLSDFNTIESIKNVEEQLDIDGINIFNIAYHELYNTALTYDMKEAKLNSINCENAQEAQRYYAMSELYKLKLAYMQCIRASSSAIIEDSNLAYLFILALNDLQIANLFKNDDELIENLFHTFIDLLLIKGKKQIITSLLIKRDLTETLLEYLIEINFSESFYSSIIDVYQTEVIDDNFLSAPNELLITFFNEVPHYQLTENDNALGNFIMEMILPATPYFNDKNTQLLNSLFARGLMPNILVGGMPYIYWLFQANLAQYDKDELKNKIEDIIYLIENGLDYGLIEQSITASDSQEIIKAKTNYAALKSARPDLIDKLQQAYNSYQQKNKRESSRKLANLNN